MAEQKFEKDLEKLEEIVAALEEGELPLDDALKRFEEGIKLAKRCEKALADAEKKIEILTKNADGTLEAQPFDEDNPEGDTGPKIRKSKKRETDDGGDGGELPF
ncbi:MAG: exodeoxyribonuclease VII small subunit [Candidatus Hydrogenedentes bacterium]|nr:exodeoxyribonuclease VII small subunit [Candidatus Hydrogenedentota bacterium]